MRLTPWLSAIRNLGFGARTRRQLQKRVARYSADSLEQLEDRTLLSYDVSLDGAGVLTISQATASDTSALDFSLAAGVYTFADAGITFNAATGAGAGNVTNLGNSITVSNVDVSSIVVTTGDGNDAITLSAFDATIDDTSINAGGEGDTINSNAAFTSDGAVFFQANLAVNINQAITTQGGGTFTVSSAGTVAIAGVGDINSDGAVSIMGTTAINTAGDVTTSNDLATFNSAVTLTGGVLVSTGSGGATFTGAVNGGNTLAVNTSGATTFSAAVGTGTALTSLTTDAGGTTSVQSVTTSGVQTYGDSLTVNGTLTTTNSLVSVTGTTTLAGATVVSTGSGGATFTGAVNGGSTLAVNTSGATTFSAAVGTGTALASLTTDAGGTTSVQSVTTSGVQTYGDNLTLNGDLDTTNSLVTVSGTTTLAGPSHVNTGSGGATFTGAVNGGNTLAVNTSGATTFSAAVGGGTPLTSLATDIGGTTSVNSVTTTGTQGYGDNLTINGTLATTNSLVMVLGTTTLAGATVVSTGSGGATFTGAVNGGNTLAVNTSGATTFSAAVGTGAALTSLTTDAGGTTSVQSVTTSGVQTYGDSLTVNGTLTTTNSLVSVAGTTTLAGATVVSTGSGGATFTGAVNGGNTLAVNTSGATTFSAAVGTGTALTSLTTDAGGTTSVQSVTTSGVQTYGDSLTVNGTLTTTNSLVSVAGTTTLAGATVVSTGSGGATFTGAVNGGNTLAVNTSGATTFSAAVGTGTALTSLTTDAGGTTSVQSVTTSGVQTYGDSLTVNGTLTTTNSLVSVAGTTTLAGATVVSTGSGGATFTGAVNGGNTLAVNTSGATTFSAAVGNSTALISASITTGTLTTGDFNTSTAAGLTVNNSGAGSMTGVISGATSVLTKQGAGTLTLSGANTYGGNTTISAGTLKLGAANVIPDGAGKGNVSVTGTLDMGGFSETINGLTGAGTVDNSTGAGPFTLTVGANNQTSTFGGVIQDTTGTIALTKTGSGVLTLGGANSYSGVTTVSNGTLLVNGSIASNVTVTSPGILGGTGGTVTGTVSGTGTVAPGSSPGILNVAGTFGPVATLAVELNGTTVGSQYDQVNVTGGVDLTGTTLTITLGVVPAFGNTFTIINNDLADAVTSTFVGLDEGEVFASGGSTFQISYTGGDGNDVVLTTINPAVPTYNGTPGADTFAISRSGGNVVTTLNGNQIDSRSVASITGMFTVNGLGGGDTLTIDFSGGNPIPASGFTYDGGAGGPDTLITQGGTFLNGTAHSTGAGAGTLDYTGVATITFTNLAPIIDDNTVTNYTIDASAGADVITIANAAGSRTIVSEATANFESISFKNKTNVTVNGIAGANDSITLADNSTPATGLSSLTVNGGGDAGDTITINNAFTLPAGTLTLTAPSISQTAGAVSLTTLNLNGAVSQTGGSAVVSGTTTIAAGAGNASLNQAANNFSTVTVTSGNDVTLVDTNGIILGASTISGNLIVTANGTITDSGNLSIAGTTTLTAGAGNDITLNNANDFGGVVAAVSIVSGNNVTLNDVNFLQFGASTISGTLSATATTAIIQTGAITAGATTLTAPIITLTNASNVLGAITVNAGSGAVSIRENDAIVITSVTHSGGSLTLNAGTNSITQTGDIEIGTNDISLTGGIITLANPNNTFGTINVASGAGDVSLRQDGAMEIGVLTRTAGNVILNANAGASDLTQIAPISIATGTIDLTAANITLTAANILGAVTINAGVGNISLTENDAIAIAAITHTGTLTLNAGTNAITQTGVINVGTGATNLTGGVITLTQANVFGAITVNNGTGAVDITENATMDISSITHNGGNLTLQAGANIINVNGPIAITGGNADFLTTGTLNLNDNVTATVITGTPTIVNVNNNTAEIQDGVDAALAGATVNVNDNVTYSENVSIPKNLTLVATIDDVIIAGGGGGAALTITAGIVSATGFYMNTASASPTVNVTGGSLTLRNNAIVESSGAAAAAITVGAGGALNMGVNATSTPGNNSITLSGAGTLLSTAVAVDASGNYWGSSDLATIEAGISPLASVDFNPYLNVGTNLAGIGFQGDFSDLSAHDDGSQAGIAAITEAYNMLTPVGTIHALTGTFTESVDLGAGANKAVTLHAGASPGQVVITGSLTLTANDTLPIELNGYVPPDALPPTGEGTTFDNFTVSGTVTLGGATLVPSVNYAAVPFDRFTIINNLSGGAVVGTFGGLPEGSIINVGGVRLRISYVEFHNPGSFPATPSFFGDGNDVSLTVMTPPVLVEQTTDGSLIITGTGWVDDITVDFSGTNMVTLIGNDVTNFFGPGTAGQIAGPYIVTGNISMSLGNSNDLVFLRGTGAGATFDSGNMLIELGSGNDSVTTTDITAPITLTSGITFTGDLSIVGGTGDDVISLGGLAAADTFAANAISIDTGTGGIQAVALDRTTVGTNVSIKNGGAGVQTVALGVLGPNSIGRDLVITQADGATGYAVGVRDTNVGRHLQITNGNGSGLAPAAVVLVDTTAAGGARTVGGLTQITNGNNTTNAVSLVGTASSLKLTGSVTVKNGNATTSNAITVTDVIDTGTTASSFTNGSSPLNSITFNGALTNTFLGTVAATNGLSTGTNAITASRLSARGVTFKNGDATTSNTITLGGAAGTDTFVVAGNTSLTNGASADIVVNVDRLTANVPSGNVTIANGASGAGGTDVIIGAVAAANSITGNLTITNQVSTGTRTNTINNATVSGGGGLSINDFGSGVSAINIGTTALVTVSKKLDIQDGSSSATTTINTATVGSMTYNDLGGGTDTINLANAAGAFQNNGVTRLNLGAGSDTVNIATTGTAIFNDSVFISLGSGNDVLNIGPNANSPAFSTANRFQFDGDGGVDQITVSPLSIADYVAGSVPKKLKSKITNFESIL